MRRIPLLLATVWTLTYMTAAQAAIAADLHATTLRAVRQAALLEPGPVWNGGTLATATGLVVVAAIVVVVVVVSDAAVSPSVAHAPTSRAATSTTRTRRARYPVRTLASMRAASSAAPSASRSRRIVMPPSTVAPRPSTIAASFSSVLPASSA